MSLHSYQRVQNQTEDPRKIEPDLKNFDVAYLRFHGQALKRSLRLGRG